MSNITVHIISDLFLGFNEFSTEEECIPDVDLVIINGNLGHPKRSMLYVETLCKKYPTTQFVYNLGESELYVQSNYPKFFNEFNLQLEQRKIHSNDWPKNLHFSLEPMIVECRGGKKVDVFCLYGFPLIYTIKTIWEETNWYKFYFKELIEDDSPEGKYYKPKGTSNVHHGAIHIPADKEWVNAMHQKEWKVAQKWELTNNGCYKILVTHFNPYKDSRLSNIEYSTYDIHIDKHCLWIGSDTEFNGVQFLGGRLYSNPGRGQIQRSKIITMY